MGIRDRFYEYRRLRGLTAHQKKMKRKLGGLKREYEELNREYQPKISKLSAQADDLASKFKGLFQQSQDCWKRGNRSEAKNFSVQGKKAQEECRARNDEANKMRFRLKDLFDQIQTLDNEMLGIEKEIGYWSKVKMRRGKFWSNFFKCLRRIQ